MKEYTKVVGLAEISETIRSLLKWFVIALLVLFFLWLIWTLISSLSRAVFRPRSADIAFGNLPVPLFAKTYNKVPEGKYDLSTNLSQSKENFEVYKLGIKSLTEEQLSKVAAAFRFSLADKKSSEGQIILTESGISLKIAVDRATIAFRDKLSAAGNQKISLSDEQITQKAGEVLTSLGLLEKDLNREPSTIKFYSVSDSGKQTSAREDANAAEILFGRKVKDSVTAGDPLVRILFSQNGSKIMEFDYSYFPLNSNPSNYTIISANEAYKKLQSGEAYSTKAKIDKSTKVTNVTLSYYESRFYQPYLQPVWIFQLTGETEAFVPAILPSLYVSE